MKLFSNSFLDENLPRQTKMEASSEGNFSVSMNTSLKCTFSIGKAGPRPLPGRGLHIKIQMRLLVHILGLKSGQIVFSFSGGGVENWRYFFRLRKATATGALFHPRLECNFQKLLRCHCEEDLQPGYTSTRCEGKSC